MIKLNLRQAEKEIQRLQKNISRYSADVQKRIDVELTEGVKDIETKASNYAPVDRGLLRGNIIADVTKPLIKTVVADTFYAPYMEFGTGRKFKPQGRASVAARFKGSANRGTIADMHESIYKWLKRVGGFPANVRGEKAKRSYAKFISFKIMRNGIEPANNGKGFFFRAYDELLPTIVGNIRKVISYKR